ncbi:beta-N-acetylhexosaminidase [Capsulimonas corticalis]|uniref:beta-N-acetylhexosaminidase n=1 Tax=Capsulimonas corticalis TaxID=2219043 RepID=A0A402CST5_9BACT|nr:beta-N-acetylhexosaminidase [Capsulimonas corticalis]BDI30986.1 beta-N-acetylhexosaminidase [Capsulimonas corticalis]
MKHTDQAPNGRNPVRTSPTAVGIVPKPNHITDGEGEFHLNAATVFIATGDAHAEASYLADYLSHAAGFPLPVHETEDASDSIVEMRIDPSDTRRGSEGYRLTVTPRRTEIVAATPAGLFHGGQTLLQLLPPTVYGASPIEPQDWTVPCVEIDDSPRFAWRGAMLDVTRHFLSVEFVKKFIDLLALHKMNVLHLHLNDDQGWRIEIKKYPKLTTIGAYRPETLVGRAMQDPSDRDFDPCQQEFDGVPHGGFYTQDEMRAIVEYARVRHVQIVPEIEMPGHAQAAVAAYPELGVSDHTEGVTCIATDVSQVWGIHPTLFNASEETFAFLQDVLTEVMEIFPSRDIHVGGDEAVKTQWRESPSIQARMRELGLEDEHALQSYFIGRMDTFLTQHGRRLIGWDEILEGGLAQNAAVMSWRGEAGGVAAAEKGHDVVMADHKHTYFDYYQSEDRSSEPLAFSNTLTLATVYHYEPIPEALAPEFAHHILGAQAQLWTEYMPDSKQVEYMALPRLAALAEVTWTDAAHKDFTDFGERLSVHFRRLDALHVNYRPTHFDERKDRV